MRVKAKSQEKLRRQSHGLLGVFPALAICIVFLLAHDRLALADYYGSYYSSYSSRSRSPSPVISLSFDPQEILNSAFRISVRDERQEDMERLLSQKADVNSRSGEGETALMYAARNCSTDIVKSLLAHGAEVNIEDNQGRTALIYAAQDSCVPVMETLLRTHAVHLRHLDHTGKSALDYATDNATLDVGGPPSDAVALLTSALSQRLRSSKASRHRLASGPAAFLNGVKPLLTSRPAS